MLLISNQFMCSFIANNKLKMYNINVNFLRGENLWKNMFQKKNGQRMP